VYVGITGDLFDSLEKQLEAHSAVEAAHVRVLSFLIPQSKAMDEIATQWRESVESEGGDYMALPTLSSELEFQGLPTPSAFVDDEDDEDDIDLLDLEEEGYDVMDFAAVARDKLKNTATVNDNEQRPEAAVNGEEQILSPFDASDDTGPSPSAPIASPGATEFTKSTVDAVLDEVRPYLISDGGNVSVIKVDEQKQDVYLKLEGACGSCASSTVTMKMGIERYV
jgi:Fe-S cluster biogenesis protein NfuA